jgi:hypothetical protein
MAYAVAGAAPKKANLSPFEVVVSHLISRDLDAMSQSVRRWLFDRANSDDELANRLQRSFSDEIETAITSSITTALMRSMALFEGALRTGNDNAAVAARERLRACADAAAKLGAVSHWWLAMLTERLVDELWSLSLHKCLPELQGEHPDAARWNRLRQDFIARLRMGRRDTVELWPSQLEGARRSVDLNDSLVVGLPTSAGKTRIAELCILRSIAAGRRCVYVTPLRALSAQIERDLRATFAPLGVSVSSLYGAAGVFKVDSDPLRTDQIVVATPEKIDFALRAQPDLLADVGLVVLDEGHMLGEGEREVRYEALVQRLLRREDAGDRRLVCLSAMFPSTEEMQELVAWIRRDREGQAVYSQWRPTRQRFGVLTWTGYSGRLELTVEDERPFVPHFIEPSQPPAGTRRRLPFPSSKNELTLAAAWRFVRQGKRVLIYSPLRASVNALAELVCKCVAQGVLESLGAQDRNVAEAKAVGAEWLGASHPAVRCLDLGVAIHHGGLPRPFLAAIERVLANRGALPVVIASPTLAQGVNLSASVLLVPSIWRNRSVIPPSEFANVAGRAGRAFVDVDGLIVHVIWPEAEWRVRRERENWERLIEASKAQRVTSGLLLVAIEILDRLQRVTGLAADDIVERIASRVAPWQDNGDVVPAEDMTALERDLASLDAALLGAIEPEVPSESLDEALRSALTGSLFIRQLQRYDEADREQVWGLVSARARSIWVASDATQRRGYYAAGVGFSAGKWLDENVDTLVALLWKAETALGGGADLEEVWEPIVEIASAALQVPPFAPHADVPGEWSYALREWLAGGDAAAVLGLLGDDGAGVLQDLFAYRLPWAMEAVRSYAVATGHSLGEVLRGDAALCVESGTVDMSVVVMLRSGLRSRKAAVTASRATGARFQTRSELRDWLGSSRILRLTRKAGWPTEDTHELWVQFVKAELRGEAGHWLRSIQAVEVDWIEEPPSPGSELSLAQMDDASIAIVSPDWTTLGMVRSKLARSVGDVVTARVAGLSETVQVEFFGPSGAGAGSMW